MKKIALLVGLYSLAAHADVVERVVAVVNNEIILLSEVKERATLLGQGVEEGGAPDARRKAQQVLRQVLDRMVEDALIVQQAGELKLSVDASEIERAVEEVRKQNKLDEQQFTEALAAQGFTPTSYRKDLRKQILRLKVINTAVRSHVNVTDEDVKSYYEQMARQSGTRRSARVSHVLVAIPPTADAKTVEQRRKIATRVLEQARDGKDFAELAASTSDDEATKGKGGDLGWVDEGDSLPPALSEVIFSMDPKEVRGPIRTDKGFEVVTLIERKDGDLRAFNDVKDSIRQQLYGTRMEKQTAAWLQEVRRKAHIDVRL